MKIEIEQETATFAIIMIALVLVVFLAKGCMIDVEKSKGMKSSVEQVKK